MDNNEDTKNGPDAAQAASTNDANPAKEIPRVTRRQTPAKPKDAMTPTEAPNTTPTATADASQKKAAAPREKAAPKKKAAAKRPAAKKS